MMEKYLLAVIVFPLLFAFLLGQFREELLHLLKEKIFEGLGNHYEIVIAVASARENFLQRQSIRDTWMGHVLANKHLRDRVEVKFVVGQVGCPIPEVDREDPYVCEWWNVSKPAFQQGEVLAVEESSSSQVSAKKTNINQAIYSLPFRVQHQVILSKLGIHRDSISSKMVVRLVDASSQMEIVSTILSPESPGLLREGFRYKAVEPYLLPKGFEGIITVEVLDGSLKQIPVSERVIHTITDTAGGIIKFYTPEVTYMVDGHYTDPLMWTANQLTIASFIYTVHDTEDLENFLASRALRDMEYWTNRSALETQLQAEAQHHQDIVFVDAVDVYRNLPGKLAKFYQWVQSERSFRFLLKTDDDCFLDVDKIVNSSIAWQHESNIWWSRFRNNWMVERYGKWAEHDYPAAVYPRFACGSGGILGADLVSWLARNADSLHLYQGEDTSLGIWLAAVAPHYVDDPHWQCERECLSSMYSMPNLTPQQLRQVWANRQACADPCGCD